MTWTQLWREFAAHPDSVECRAQWAYLHSQRRTIFIGYASFGGLFGLTALISYLTVL